MRSDLKKIYNEYKSKTFSLGMSVSLVLVAANLFCLIFQIGTEGFGGVKFLAMTFIGVLSWFIFSVAEMYKLAPDKLLLKISEMEFLNEVALNEFIRKLKKDKRVFMIDVEILFTYESNHLKNVSNKDSLAPGAAALLSKEYKHDNIH